MVKHPVTDITREEFSELCGFDVPASCEALEERWYRSLAAGRPDYGVYDAREYMADLWKCWATYSRRYIRDLRRVLFPKLRGARLIVDLGCGAGLTTAALAESFPGARVVGTNLRGGAQWLVAEKLAKACGFHLRERPSKEEADLALAFEYFEHFEDPIFSVQMVVARLSPRLIATANSFTGRAVGHFTTYSVGGRPVEPREVGRIFGRVMRDLEYEKQRTGLWNERPAVWRAA